MRSLCPSSENGQMQESSSSPPSVDKKKKQNHEESSAGQSQHALQHPLQPARMPQSRPAQDTQPLFARRLRTDVLGWGPLVQPRYSTLLPAPQYMLTNRLGSASPITDGGPWIPSQRWFCTGRPQQQRMSRQTAQHGSKCLE